MPANYYVLIVAGGSGTRMQTSVPKQFLLLAGKPVLWHTLQAFATYADHQKQKIRLVVVLPEEWRAYWQSYWQQQLLSPYVEYNEATGGATRSMSVWSGLQTLMAHTNDKQQCVVAVHDAARPLVSVQLIARCFDMARQKGSAVPVVPVRDSVRLLQGDGTHCLIDREALRLVQTPQVFRMDWLLDAYLRLSRVQNMLFTDDASLLEWAGYPLYLTEGEYSNLKITVPEDMTFAQAWLQAATGG